MGLRISMPMLSCRCASAQRFRKGERECVRRNTHSHERERDGGRERDRERERERERERKREEYNPESG